MNKAELIEEVSNRTGVTKKNVGNVINAVIKVVSDALKNGSRVTLVDFGSFQVIEKKARRGVNPQTKESIQIPAKKVPKFVAGKGLREAIIK
ncbi:MAG TPA: HU family DNA-binding protein [Candidatus Aerophobetes bacterium]|uniref:DNA-binding protein n=1 Tax=Aerophobetes bacterium TaxID=2030807 RepID=A0A662DHG5_UNCAE|nr:MAG: DNA-binding protein [Candidatus Aerophobetes bacterium]HDN85182.1 HU family DNA-binding protein [Candidatus Aerophobetes bacterium]